ncbi:DELTA-actitoxin-Ucs1a-like [Rhinophrynus dorsalis]
MQKSIAELLNQVDSTRCVGIEISNKSESVTLSSPSTFCGSGYVCCPPAPTISPGTVENCVFVKTPHAARGSVGVLKYHLSNERTIVIMFSNPYDYNLYYTTFGIWITDSQCIANSDLFNDLYYYKQECDSFKRIEVKRETNALEIKKENLCVSATMSNDHKAILKVDIKEK